MHRDEGDAALLLDVVFLLFLALLIERHFIEKAEQTFVRTLREIAEIANDVADVTRARVRFFAGFAGSAQLFVVTNFDDELANE